MSKKIRLFLSMLLFFCGTVIYLSAKPAESDENSKKIAIVEIKEAITPVTVKLIQRSLTQAETEHYDMVIFTLDTPGGLVDSTREIVQAIMQADKKGIDTVVYVSPTGSRAGSAGVFITLSAKYAVMAPGCNIGAAHPVTIGGGGGGNDKEEKNDDNAKHLAQKIENDTIAFIKSIAVQRGRNIDWAVNSVKNSVSITSEEALDKKVIDFIADSNIEIVEKVYGKNVKYSFIEIKKSWGEGLLSVLANPNLSYLFFVLGLLGIGVEIRSPGLIFPGALGALFFILGLYSTQVLPINYAGLFLIILSVVLFILEITIVSHGLLTIGGIIALILGSAMLFDSPLPFMRVNPWVIFTVVFIIVGLMGLVLAFVIPSLKNKVVSGREGMVDEIGVAAADFVGGKGQVKVHGEIWNGHSTQKIKKGDEVKIVSSQGMKLEVVKEN